MVGGGYELDEATVMMLTRKGDMLKLKVLDTKGHILKNLNCRRLLKNGKASRIYMYFYEINEVKATLVISG